MLTLKAHQYASETMAKLQGVIANLKSRADQFEFDYVTFLGTDYTQFKEATKQLLTLKNSKTGSDEELIKVCNQSLILAERIAQAMYQQLAYPSLKHQVEKIAENYTIEQLPNLNKAMELLRIVDPNKLDENTVTRLIGLEEDLNIELRAYQNNAKKLYDKLSKHTMHLSQLCEDVALNPLGQQAKTFLTKLESSRTNLVELREYEVEFMALREQVKIAVAPRITTAKSIGDDSIELTKIGRNENKQTLDTRWKAGEVFNYKEFRTQLLREAYIDKANEEYKTMPEQKPNRTVKVKFNN